MLRVLPVLLALALVIYALVDCAQTESRAVRNLPRVGWFAVIVLLPVVGAISWLLSGRPAGAGTADPPPRGPIGPDDDPDFLRQIRPSE